MSKERVLITGGSGYIGSVLTGHLLERGYIVTCLDNLMYGQKSLLYYASHPNFNFIYGDVRDKNLMKETIKDKEIILPLAAIVGAPACDIRYNSKSVNFDSIVMLDKIRSKDQKIVCPITNSGYGTKTGESYCNEESPLNPISIYGRAKIKAEKALLESSKDAITLRLATVFGISPRMRIDLLVNDFVYQAYTNKSIVIFQGDFKRNFLYIQDVSRAFHHSLLNYDKMKNNAYNVGDDEANMSKLELAMKIKKHIPSFDIHHSENGEDPDKRDYIVSNDKIRRTGFEVKTSLDEGIDELIKGYNILMRNNLYTNI